MITLKNWALVSGDNPYRAPETDLHLSGAVYGHPRHENGKNVVTSHIVEAVRDGDICGIIKTSSGSEYAIYASDVNPEYEKLYPDAFNRLFKHGVC
jgi:hypothetical protein